MAQIQYACACIHSVAFPKGDIVRCARWLVLGITGEAHPVTMATTLQKMRQMQVNPSKAPYTLRVGKELVSRSAGVDIFVPLTFSWFTVVVQ